MSFSEGSPILGVDLGGSNVRVGLFHGAGEAVAERAEPTARGSAASVVAQLGDLGRSLARDEGVPWESIEAVGVGVPGVLAGGRLRLAPNLPPFGDVEVESALAQELGLQVVVDNDVNMATLGEHLAGHGEGVDDFVFLAIGTGVGMGIVASGRLLRGAHGAAGEIGAVPVGPLNEAHATVEEVAGGVAVAQQYADRARSSRELTAAAVYAAAEAGDATAAAVLDEQVAAVAYAVAAAQSILDPELIVLGGGIGSRADFTSRVRQRLERVGTRPVHLEPSALGEAAGMIGAAHAARLHLLERVDV